MIPFFFFFLFLFVPIAGAQTSSGECPLNFAVLRKLLPAPTRPAPRSNSDNCQYILQSLRLVQSDHLRRTSLFLPSPESAESCWSEFQNLTADYLPRFDIRSSCGFQTSWISEGCMNITTRAQFETRIPTQTRSEINEKCNGSLLNGSPCASCITELTSLRALYLTGLSVGNVSDCSAYPFIYAAAFANAYGPADVGTAKCLFSLNFAAGNRGKKKSAAVLAVVAAVSGVLLLGSIGLVWWLWRRRAKENLARRRREVAAAERERGLGTALESIGESGNVVKFGFDEIKAATRGFSRDNIVGRGGYGNVYRGTLADGTEIAVKRFKNCSAAGDASFAHEVEVIASVRHVNLVALRGYCIATSPFEGHQRIIVCDLMKNGSLHDHLFAHRSPLTWRVRKHVALGTARGIAYLHYGAQPAIIHRDIKANNILLDDDFNAQVADFGLAKFTPEGITHMSTRVAGTMGYVAPEYALYGQVSERSDVYSFGVLFLELLSGKKALIPGDEDNPPVLLTDWAWALVKEGRAFDVVEDNLPEKGEPDALEKCVLVAVLCSHPQPLARPTMDQVVKMLETDISVPAIPDRPISIVADLGDIERSMSSISSASTTGFHQYCS